jgi:protease-4
MSAMARRGLAVVLSLLGIAVLVSITALVGLYLLLGREPAVPASATLTVELGGDLLEVVPSDVFGYLRGARTPTLRAVVDNLRKAKVDPRVRAVLLKPTGFTTPYWAKIQEIRDAVEDFRESGKPVFAHLEYAGDREYYLATAADRVFLMPSTTLDLTGVASYHLFLRGTLDKVGVQADLHHIGDYKTAPNTFTETGFTDADREMSTSLARDLYDQLVGDIADARGKDESELEALIDQGPFLADEALRAGLVDELAYADQVEAELQAASGVEEAAGERTIDLETYERVSLASVGLNRGPRIAVIYAAGAIVGGRSGHDPINGPVVGSETLIEHLRDAREDSSIRAIVLRIDSPGGSATASDAIWRELMLTRSERADRPIVASMSDLAASGGYYIAMPADVIVAQPSTLTGSIGIFGGKFVVGGAYEKLGADIESVSVGRRAEMNSPARPYNPDELSRVQAQLEAFYRQFIQKVADARAATPEEIDRVAQGRVWSGHQAVEQGLVDALGGLRTAVELAKERANIDADSDVELVVFPPKKSFYEMLSEELSGGGGQTAGAWISEHLSRTELDLLRALRGPATLFRRGEVLALMPFTFLR